MINNMNFITPLQPWEFGNIQSSGKVTGAQNTGMFKETFQEIMATAKNSENTLAQQQYLLATGQLENPHDLMIASSNAQTSIELLVALRDKALQAYNELMRVNL